VTTSSTIERAAAAALFWSQPCRRSEDAVRGSLAGLSDEERLMVCGLLAGGELDRLTDDELLGKMHELAAKTRPIENKIAEPEGKSAPAAALPMTSTDAGSFSGYLAVVGNRDHQGDTILPGALDATLREFNSGGIRWLITDSHSDSASDVVAEVKAAVVDSHGLRVEAQWMPTERAQQLRAMVLAGAQLGLSIDYYPRRTRSDGKDGRILEDVAVVGGAITPKPANPLATIVSGKGAPGGFSRVLTVSESIAEGAARRERESPQQRRAEDAMLAAASWPPPHFPRETRLRLIRGVAEAKARRELAGDPARVRAQARRDRDNAYGNAMARTLARLERERCGHRSCMPGRCAYR
jgi:HK97 family phage prohead protease